VSCGTGDNKRKEVLTFEVANFNIEYNCILRRPFLLKFMSAIHVAYAMLNMFGPKGVITIKTDQHDALACENATLTHVERFGDSTSFKSSAPKPPTIGSPQPPSAKKGTYGASASNQYPADQPADGKKKEADDKEVPVDPSNSDKKLQINTCLEAK
jgi:hypothetical protein